MIAIASCAITSPISPPRHDSTIASTRNCNSTSRATAPIASRMPISRVRSVTDTSMMFMIPIPPTTRLIPATAATMPVSNVVVPVSVSEICLVSKMLKSSSLPAVIVRRSRSRSVIDACTVAVENFWSTPTSIRRMSRLPVKRRCTALIGMMTTSS